MNKWLEEEEFLINSEIRKAKYSKQKMNPKRIILLVMILFLGGALYLKSDEIITCPHCQSYIELEPPQAKEVPGAGWYCNKCGQFQCHGQKCWWCGWPRSEKY